MFFYQKYLFSYVLRPLFGVHFEKKSYELIMISHFEY